MSSVTITLPWPPSANHYWERRIVLPRSWGRVLQPFLGEMWKRLARNFIGDSPWPNAQTFIGQKGKSFRADVEAALVARFGTDISPIDFSVAIRVVAMMPDRRVRDLSNLLKATEDALTHANVWADDSLIDRITIERGPVKKGGELVITIEPMPVVGPSQKELFRG